MESGFLESISPMMSGLTGIANIGGTIGNYALQREQMAYQRDLQNRLFQREDNAVQRRVADLEAAGLSPVLAAGSSAQAGPVVSTVTPHFEALEDVGKKMMDTVGKQADIATNRAQQVVLWQQSQLMREQIKKTQNEGEIAAVNLDALRKGVQMRTDQGLMPDVTGGTGVELSNMGSWWKEALDELTKGEPSQAFQAALGLLLKMGMQKR